MQILQLTKKFPFPIRDGESIAITALSRGLSQQGCQISLLAMNTSKHRYFGSDYAKELAWYKQIERIEVNNKLNVFAAFRNLFSSSSYHVNRFISNDYAAQLEAMLKEQTYDIVQLESMYLVPYIPIIRKHSSAQVVLRAHNVEHEIWERISANTSFAPKRWYIDHLTRKLKNVEVKMLDDIDILLAITKRDLDCFTMLGFQGRGHVVPIGIDRKVCQIDTKSFEHQPTFSFIGSLDWMPNLEGVDWMIKHVWDSVLAKHPYAVIELAGRNTPKHLLKQQQKGISFLGEVPSSIDFLNQHSVMVVPLLSGSGMRAKIIEGMALGRVVISTTLGAEGIGATHKQNIIIADTAEDFAAAMNWCLSNPDKLQIISQSAHQFIVKNYSSSEIAATVLSKYRRMAIAV